MFDIDSIVDTVLIVLTVAFVFLGFVGLLVVLFQGVGDPKPRHSKRHQDLGADLDFVEEALNS